MKERQYKSEKDVKRRVKQIFETHGYFWWMPPMNGFGKTGVADFNAIKHGVFFAVETKFKNNKPTHRQCAFLESITAEQGYGFLVNETNVEWLDVFLSSFARAIKAQQAQEKPTPEDGAAMLNAIREMTRYTAGPDAYRQGNEQSGVSSISRMGKILRLAGKAANTTYTKQ